jgi:hypothetical protein
MTIFKDETQNWKKLCTFKNLYLFKVDSKQTYDILETINTINKKLQNISFENAFL